RCATSASTVTAPGFCAVFLAWARPPWRPASRSSSCGYSGTASASPCTWPKTARGLALTRRKTWSAFAPSCGQACKPTPISTGYPRWLTRLPAEGRRLRLPGDGSPTESLSKTKETDETHSPGSTRRRQGHPSHVHLPEIRHSPDLDRRHVACSRQGRHSAGPAGQGGDGVWRAGQR